MSEIPPVDGATLARLLGAAAEGENVDFKAVLDVRGKAGPGRRALLNLIADMASIGERGGYIVGGVDESDRGPSRQFTSEMAEALDQAKLADQARRYVKGLRFEVARHKHPDDPSADVSLIGVAPHPRGFLVMVKDGDPADGGKLVFRKGDVFVRDGSQSRPWTEEDAERLFARRHAQLDLDQSPEAFTSTLLAMLDGGRTVMVREFLSSLPAEAGKVWKEEQERPRLEQLIDRLTLCAAAALHHDQPKILELALRAFERIYQLPLEPGGYVRPGLERLANGHWYRMVDRLIALGALAVRLGKWAAVRQITLIPAGEEAGTDPGRIYWLSAVDHAIVMANRANISGPDQDIVSEGVACALRLAPLASDAASEDELRDSVVQFGVAMALCLVAEQEAEQWDADRFPLFFTAADQTRRAVPNVVWTLYKDPQAITALSPHLAPEEIDIDQPADPPNWALRRALTTIGTDANTGRGWWLAFRDERVRKILGQ